MANVRERLLHVTNFVIMLQTIGEQWFAAKSGSVGSSAGTTPDFATFLKNAVGDDEYNAHKRNVTNFELKIQSVVSRDSYFALIDYTMCEAHVLEATKGLEKAQRNLLKNVSTTGSRQSRLQEAVSYWEGKVADAETRRERVAFRNVTEE